MNDFKVEPVTNLTELAELIRSIPYEGEKGFDMDSPYFMDRGTHCGTVACIGGWLLHANTMPDTTAFEDEIVRIAPNVTWDDAHALCYKYPPSGTITQKQAARAIEILRDTGGCDWARAVKEGEE